MKMSMFNRYLSKVVLFSFLCLSFGNDLPRKVRISYLKITIMDKTKRTWKFTEEDKQNMIKLWLDGKSTYSIAQEFDTYDETVRLIIKKKVQKDLYEKTAKEHMKRFDEKRQVKPISKPYLNEELAWWVGVVKGDGYVGRYCVKLAVKDKCLADRWAIIGSSLFNIFPKSNKTKRGLYAVWFNSVLLVNFLKKGFGLFGKYIWDIPASIKEAQPEIMFGFLRGLFDAEGCAKLSRKACAVSIISVRHECMEQIKEILNKYNIKSILREEKRKDRKNTYYVITIWGFDNIRKFAKNINFTIKRKCAVIFDYLNYMCNRYKNRYHDSIELFRSNVRGREKCNTN